GVLPRHGHEQPRSHRRHGQKGDDARAGEGGEADRRLRSALVEECLHRRHVRRGGLQEPDAEETGRGEAGGAREEEVTMRRRNGIVASLVALGAALWLAAGVDAQRGAVPGPALTAKAAAPIDISGYWVSLVTDDWRWRM